MLCEHLYTADDLTPTQRYMAAVEMGLVIPQLIEIMNILAHLAAPDDFAKVLAFKRFAIEVANVTDDLANLNVTLAQTHS